MERLGKVKSDIEDALFAIGEYRRDRAQLCADLRLVPPMPCFGGFGSGSSAETDAVRKWKEEASQVSVYRIREEVLLGVKARDLLRKAEEGDPQALQLLSAIIKNASAKEST